MSATSLLTRLPRVALHAARLRTSLLAALDGLEVDGVALAAEGTDRVPEGGWIVFNAAPGRVLLRLSGSDPFAAADALGRSEPLVAAIETALGLELVPTVLVERPAPDAVVVALAHGTARVWLAVAPTVDIEPPTRAQARPSLATLDVPVVVRIAGATLGRADLAALAPGDMLLLPADAPATLSAAERTAHGRLTAAPARLRVLSVGNPSPEISMSLDASVQLLPIEGLAQHPIPITVELANVTVPLATLSGLAPGSVLPLGLAGQSLPVRLTVGGRAVASGELVAVGEGYGVLIERRQD